MRMFWFGTLMDPDIRHLVLGHDIPDDMIESAELPGFTRVFVDGHIYPMIVPSPGDSVQGVLVKLITVEDVRAVMTYEGDEYQFADIDVVSVNGDTVSAKAFLAGDRQRASSVPWNLEEWRQGHKWAFIKEYFADPTQKPNE